MGLVALDDHDAIGPGVMSAVLLLVFGVGLVVSAFRGRARGLLLPALAVGLALSGLAALDVRADTVAGPFDTRVTRADDLRAEYTSAVGRSELDLADLRLDADRTVDVRVTAGTLRIVLPRDTDVRGTVERKVGTIVVARPSGVSAIYNRGLADRWLSDGMPAPGDALSNRELRLLRDWEIGAGASMTQPDRGRFSTSGNDGPVLRLHVHMGVGDVTIVDPHWGELPAKLHPAEQLCTVGGGARGVVLPCSQVPEANRVALCINEADFLVDCREDRPGTPDWPRIAACRGIDGNQRPCIDLDIDPVGAPLISATTVPEDTIAPADDGPVPPPDPLTPPSTVPPVDPSSGGA